ncbi:photosystem II assembly protein Psb34 [Synechococcus sp. BDU 130192]|uniref:photosystem II assembly protein Psb34 n=1 Tax=Synechococcus sp. BDU 130192 TaxID=2042059 RepID=UPI000C0745E1|nr:ssl1498 family light-harvesting-like protein [Synechococcus sp. BDU 130192]
MMIETPGGLKIDKFEGATMRYMEDEDGKLNNFAQEPKMYQAEAKTAKEQKNLLVIGVLGGVLVATLIGVTVLISG